MKFGLADADYRFISEALRPLRERGATVWCFGSRARGDHRRFSDLDLMVEGPDDLSRAVADLKEVFEESRLPIKVDLVQLREFAESYRPGFEADKQLF